MSVTNPTILYPDRNLRRFYIQINKGKFVDELAGRTGFMKKDSKKVLDETLDIIIKALQEEYVIEDEEHTVTIYDVKVDEEIDDSVFTPDS